jgi:hypothetical protein
MGRKKVILDEFHYHEALDRSYIVAELLETALIEHVVINKHKNLKKKLQKAQELIIEVYQEIGGLSITEFPDQPQVAEQK